MAEVYRTPKDVLCLGCRLKFTISADEFDSQVKKGAIEEHNFAVMNYSAALAKYTCRDCPHCRKEGGPRPTVAHQLATIRMRRMELESLGQDRAEATSTAVAEQMLADDRKYAPGLREYLR